MTVNSWGGLSIATKRQDGSKQETHQASVEKEIPIARPKNVEPAAVDKVHSHVVIGKASSHSESSWGGMTTSTGPPKHMPLQQKHALVKPRMPTANETSWAGMTVSNTNHRNSVAEATGPSSQGSPTRKSIVSSTPASLSKETSWGGMTFSKTNHPVAAPSTAVPSLTRGISTLSWGGLTLAETKHNRSSRYPSQASIDNATVASLDAKSFEDTTYDGLPEEEEEDYDDDDAHDDEKEEEYEEEYEDDVDDSPNESSLECIQLRKLVEELMRDLSQVREENMVLKQRIVELEGRPVKANVPIHREQSGGAPFDSFDAGLPTVPLEEGITMASCFSQQLYRREPAGRMPQISESSVVSGESMGEASQMEEKNPEERRVENMKISDYSGESGSYTGLLKNGMPNGLGRMLYDEGMKTYDGEWHLGRWHGFGIATLSNGDCYEGEFSHDRRHGQGHYEWRDGRVYDGGFEQDMRHGRGVYLWPDGAKYEGDFMEGLRHGKGKYIFHDGGRYDGNWVGGSYDGFGTCTWADGRSYTGQWKNGLAHGKGVETLVDGTIRHDGQWNEGEPVL